MNTLEYKQLLTQKLAALKSVEDVSADAGKTVELDQSKIGRLSRMDALQHQAISNETNRRRKVEITKIKNALLRIENDEFGYCLGCDEVIAENRLKFDPAATLCIHCASKKENQ